MDLCAVKDKISSGGYDAVFEKLYSDLPAAKARYTEMCEEFLTRYGDGQIHLYSAPGRTEVGGNHTDHQKGCVLAGSVDLDAVAVCKPTDDGIVRIKSKGFKEDVVDTADLEYKESESGRAASLIRGILAEFKKRGYNIGGFCAYTTSNVLKGSGLSSSAAFEILVCVAVNALYNNCKMDAVEMAKISQIAENQYYGKPSGLMDQMACSVGSFIAIDFADDNNPVIEKVEYDLDKSGHKLCIVDAGGNHADLTDDYAAITKECREISTALGVTHLRYAKQDEFFARIAQLSKKFGERAVLRAMHFFADNQRAVDEKLALKKGDFEEFLRLVNLSGNSSYKYLQNVFSCSCPTQQGVSLALALTERYLNGKGACRVHGGGFAGTIQAFVPEDMLSGYVALCESVFGKGKCHVLKIRPVGGCVIE